MTMMTSTSDTNSALDLEVDTTRLVLADCVAAAALETYNKLPKRGKPQRLKEWTLLSAVILRRQDKNQVHWKTVSLATGSKCIGRSKMSAQGDVINDSHAEVLARRGFLRYLYDELDQVYSGGLSEVFQLPDDCGRCSLTPGVSFHLFTSHTPCGDASIFPKEPLTGDTSERILSTEVQEYGEVCVRVTEESCDTCDTDRVTHNTNIGQDISLKNQINKSVSCCEEPPDLVSNGVVETHPPELVSNGGLETHPPELVGKSGTTSQPFDLPTKTSINFHYPTSTAKVQSVKRKSCRESGSNGGDVDRDIKKRLKCGPSHETRLSCMPATVGDIHRTGAKCVPIGQQDSLGPASLYHSVGPLRTKPGRGERTLSMACSDKLARWTVLGCQGSLLSLFFTAPIYFTSLVVGSGPFSKEAMERAVYSRVKSATSWLPAPYTAICPELLQAAQAEFVDSRAVVERLASESSLGKVVPSSAAVIWYKTSEAAGCHLDVVVNGRRQGFTKSSLHKVQARSSVCSVSLFQRFCHLVQHIQPHARPKALRNFDTRICVYSEVKALATEYMFVWRKLQKHSLHGWIPKPDNLRAFPADLSCNRH